MNRVRIIRGNGGVGTSGASKDPVSGLLFYVPSAAYSALQAVEGSPFATARIAKFRYAEDAEAAGLTAAAADWHVRLMAYHVAEAYRINSGVELWVGVYERSSDEDYGAIAEMQRAAKGELRQVGVWDGATTLSDETLSKLQTIADRMEAEQTPMSLVYSGKSSKSALLGGTWRAAGRKNVSVVVGQDGANVLSGDAGNSGSEAVGMVGLAIGLMSAAGVNESIGWVGKFATGIEEPALIDGTLMSAVSKTEQETLDEAGLLFLVTYPGYEGSYVNDSHTMDKATSDYAYIERERVMDKAVRGVYASLLPYLGSSLYVDADGSLRADSRANLVNVCNQPLEAMEAAGELSGYRADIDPKQDVLSTSTVEVVIKQVGVGVLRTMRVKIGYVKSI